MSIRLLRLFLGGLCGLLLGAFSASGQGFVVSGYVHDREGQPILGARIQRLGDSTRRVSSGLEGEFRLEGLGRGDTLLISHSLYQPQRLLLARQPRLDSLVVQLRERERALAEVEILARAPIAHRFAGERMTELDVYLNPLAQADPLKAVTALASSTAATEQANPEFRGSPAAYSLVTINKVPIESPVRYSGLSNQGFFSLFHPALLDQQWVYASNPPITAGKALSGLVDVRSRQRLEASSTALSLGMAGVSVVRSQRLGSPRSFVQLYGNAQRSDLLTALAPESYPELRRFSSLDLGMNLRLQLAPRLVLQLYSYGLLDAFRGETGTMNYAGEVRTRSRRFFSVLNLRHSSERLGVTSLNLGYDRKRPSLSLGLLDLQQRAEHGYLSLEHKLQAWGMELEGGLAWDGHYYALSGQLPRYAGGFAPGAPARDAAGRGRYGSLDAYLYAYRPLLRGLLDLSLGLRYVHPMGQEDAPFLSYQGMLQLQPALGHRLLLGAGVYRAYVPPALYATEGLLCAARGLNLDYEYRHGARQMKVSVYLRREDVPYDSSWRLHGLGRRERRELPSWGVEYSWEDVLSPRWSYGLALSALRRQRAPLVAEQATQQEWGYFAKLHLQWSHPRYFTASLAYLAHRGPYLAKVSGAEQLAPGIYVPRGLSWERGADYQRLDLQVFRYMSLGRSMLTLYASLSNLLNTANVRERYFSPDYSTTHPLYLQRRALYLGAMLSWH